MEDLSLEGFTEEQFKEIKALWQKYHDENNTWLNEKDKGTAFRKFCSQVFKWSDFVIDENLKQASPIFEAGIEWYKKQNEIEIQELRDSVEDEVREMRHNAEVDIALAKQEVASTVADSKRDAEQKCIKISVSNLKEKYVVLKTN